MSKNQTIKIKQDKLKQALLEQLKRTPTIELACEKVGVSRMSYYRWCRASKKFAKQADEAIIEGRLFISDVAESQIFSLIKDKKIEAIKFWLAHNAERYGNKLEIKGHITHSSETLTPEQEKLLRKALELALPKQTYEQNKNKENGFSEDTGEDDEGQKL